jgi:Malonyl-CoA decarboxylase C-terminal domain
MLHIIQDLKDSLLDLIKDDPVRPELTPEFRVNDNSRIFVLTDDETHQPLAVTCVKFLGKIPESVDDMTNQVMHANTAVFYTIWSYAAGAGRTLITEAQEEIRRQHPEVNTYVTLSPKTEMARRFHLKNGAEVYRENPTTVNYLYR